VAFRLEAQGLKHAQRSDYAVRSITIGTGEFTNLIKPFVSDLAFRCIQSEWSQPTAACSFRPYNGHAAILFIDMSGYSKITAAIAHRGAHFLSHHVNSYLEKLLTIIQRHGGDVIKFAGDAVVAVWDGPKEYLDQNVLCAATCALQMQRQEPSHTVVGPPAHPETLAFRIHCGIAAGVIESEVFRATTHEHMQQFFHSVGGEPLARIGEIVEVAKAGEIGVDSACVDCIRKERVIGQVLGKFRDVRNLPQVRILESLELDAAAQTWLDEHAEDLILERQEIRSMERALEDNFIHKFIHPKVLGLLSHGGLTPTQIAQVRNLCVLFIAMTSNSSSVNWLMEVQSILDRNRCPIVQIIDDDKGVVRPRRLRCDSLPLSSVSQSLALFLSLLLSASTLLPPSIYTRRWLRRRWSDCRSVGS
jgi:class 3 adenylate cyclase